MTNAKETYEAKILETLIKNSERLAVVETKLTLVETGVENLQRQVTNLDSKVDNLGSRLAVVETKLTVVETKLTVVDTGIETLQQQMDNNFDTLNTKLNWLFGAVFAVAASILATLYSEPLLSALGR